MRFLLARAFLTVFLFDLYLIRGSFRALYNRVRNYPVAKEKQTPHLIDRVASAVDMACIWYPKRALCLQRSATITCLLRNYGIPAQMVVGAQQMPFRAHAWVEVSGRIVSDKPYVSEMYAVLDRC